jgi:hypothetical protein
MLEVSDYLEQYRQLWEQRFDQLDSYLKTLQTQGNANE